MKRISSRPRTVCALLGVAATLTLLAVDADARSRSSSSGGSRGSSGVRSHSGKLHSHSGARFTTIPRTVVGGRRIGAVAPLVGPSWYYTAPPYAYSSYAHVPPAYMQDQGELYMEPLHFVEQAGGTAPQQDYWYYCEATQTYYPYVASCVAPWVRVIPYPLP